MWALGTFSDEIDTFPGLVLDERSVVDLRGHGWASVREIFEDWASAETSLDTLACAGESVMPLDGLSVRAPVVPDQILQSGANYRRHVLDIILAEERERGSMSEEDAREMGERIMDERSGHGEPYVFLGAASALCGPYDAVRLPERGIQHDWEVELAAVIGAGGRHIARDEALGHLAGYTIANDLTTRDVLYREDLKAIGTDWLAAKNAPTFLPVGPWIVPARFVADPQDLVIRLELNGEVMQDASTADMIFDVATLISYVSTLVDLRPGDLLLTGSPAGNGKARGRFLRDGDVMVSSITNRCHAAAAVTR